ncbi:MAG: trypsin-like peptidase domain-containing protein [Candidatus Omnitrophica bacterium]|nr:trypsin-like peptidase domain-containing protein [Candidatus Omnitrophota bacterium]
MNKNQSQQILWLWVGGIVLVLAVIAFATQSKAAAARQGQTLLPDTAGQVAIAPATGFPAPAQVQPQAGAQLPAGAAPGMNTGALENTYNQVADVMSRITVSIYTTVAGQPQPQLLGSGVVVGRQVVLTNAHIVQNSVGLFVMTNDAPPVQYPVTLCRRDPANDLVLLQVTNNVNFQSVGIFGNSDLVDRGDIVFATGNAFGTGNLMATGMIIDNNYSYTAGGLQFTNKFRTNINVYPGSCGGPLVNIKGEVVGINYAAGDAANNYMGIGYATPINRVLAMLNTNTANNAGTGGAAGNASPFVPAAFNNGNPYTLT